MGYENYRVVEVPWYGAHAYCRWLEGRLPTEAEWEYVAGGTTQQKWPDCSLFNFANCIGGVVPIGSYPDGKTPLGIMDMAGNVWEWVQDWYDPAYYTLNVLGNRVENPTGPLSGLHKMYKGGGWYSSTYYIRPSYRGATIPDTADNTIGFRCVKESTTPPKEGGI